MSAERLVDVLCSVVRETVTLPSLPEHVSEAQWAALRYLANHRRSSLADAATALGISRPAASRLFKRLVQREWVARHSDSSDMRYIELDLTPSGRQVVTDVSKVRTKQFQTVFDRMSPDEVDDLGKGVKAFIAAALGVESFNEQACLKCQSTGAVLCPGAQEVLRHHLGG